MSWEVQLSKRAVKDAKKIAKSNLKPKALALLQLPEQAPYQTPPTYEALTGNLKGLYSRRINIQHRLVYQVYDKEKVVKVLRLWTHYE